MRRRPPVWVSPVQIVARHILGRQGDPAGRLVCENQANWPVSCRGQVHYEVHAGKRSIHRDNGDHGNGQGDRASGSDALRALMPRGGESVFGIATDFAVLMVGVAVLIGVAARLYGRMGS